MFDQYPNEINNTLSGSIYKDTFHFVEEALDAGIAEKNLQTGDQRWSSKFFDLLGYKENEIPATSENFIHCLLHPDDKKIFSDAVERLHKTSKSHKIEIRLKTKQGIYK